MPPPPYSRKHEEYTSVVLPSHPKATPGQKINNSSTPGQKKNAPPGFKHHKEGFWGSSVLNVFL